MDKKDPVTENLSRTNSSISLRISMIMAFVGGVATPVLETIRRWEQLTDLQYFINWFDDYLIGGFLLFAAWKTLKSPLDGSRYLIAAWGFAAGMSFSSLIFQIQILDRIDPSGIDPTIIVIVKSIMLMTCIVCLFLAAGKNQTSAA